MKKTYIKCHQWGYQQEGLHLTIEDRSSEQKGGLRVDFDDSRVGL
jgi:hypothetical protein